MPPTDATRRFARLRELFESALDLTREERRAFVEREASGDPELARELARMLAKEEQPSGFLNPPTPATLAAQAPALPAIERGTRLGDFVIEERIAHGGMGSVYRARQDKPARTVALKLLGSLPTPELARRFELEAEILGRLQHPSIATIHQSGVYATPGGFSVPYLAMELVEGARDVVRFAREERLVLQARLALLRQVCAAVHHAHQRGVIHRDLKPGNLLVDAAGQVKVIDYGVARVLEARDTAHTLAGHVLGTVQYASPEQLDGDARDVDVRTDVYSLGVVLYELVTGRVPCDVSGLSITQALARVAEHEAEAPSRVTRELPRELDWIVLTALARERERRYGSAQELCDDLARFERGEPLSAAPPSAAYRARKFVARHKLGVSAAALVFASIVVGIASTRLALIEARAQNQRAERALERQQAVLSAVRETLAAVKPDEKGREVTLAALLERRSAALTEDVARTPDVEAALQGFLSESYEALGLFEQAANASSAAIAAWQRSPQPDVAQRAQNRLRLARMCVLRTQYDEARAELELAWQDLQSAGMDRGAPGVDALRLRAELTHKSGDTQAALALFEDAVALSEQVQGADHFITLRLMADRSSLLLGLGRKEEAEVAAKHVYERSLAVLGPEHPFVLPVAMRYGSALQAQGKFDALVPLQHSVVAGAAQAYGATHRNTVVALQSLAAAQVATGAHAAGEASAREAVAIADTHHALDAEIAGFARLPLANALSAQGKLEEARSVLEVAVARMASGATAKHPILMQLRSLLADTCMKLAQPADAERELRLLLDSAAAAQPAQHPSSVTLRARLAHARYVAAPGAALRAELEATLEELRQLGTPEAQARATAIATVLK